MLRFCKSGVEWFVSPLSMNQVEFVEVSDDGWATYAWGVKVYGDVTEEWEFHDCDGWDNVVGGLLKDGEKF